jgi:hypothetical protein
MGFIEGDQNVASDSVCGLEQQVKQLEDERNHIFQLNPSMEPIGKCSANFNFNMGDALKINELREWSRLYFKNQFVYEQSAYMQLTRIKERLQNEQFTGPDGRHWEYEMILRIEDILIYPLKI